MKLKQNYALRSVANTWVVLPMGTETVNFNGMITLNESGAFLWRALEHGGDRESLADALMQEYIVDREEALADVDVFLQKLQTVGCIE